VLVAGVPTIYPTTALASTALGADVTKLYLNSTAGGNFSLRVLLDETP
jgi:hypothetical protein